jgi:hypothetical protein
VSNPFLNIGNLGAEAEEPSNYWDNYDVPTAGGNNTIPAGRYTFQVPQPGEDFKPGETKEKVFCFEMNPTVATGEHKGKQIKFFRSSIKKFSNRNGSQAGDLLIGTGLWAPNSGKKAPTNRNEWARKALELGGKKFDALVKLAAWDKVQGKELPLLKRKDAEGKEVDKLKYVLTHDNIVIHFPDDPEKEKAAEEAALANGGRTVWANSKIERVHAP